MLGDREGTTTASTMDAIGRTFLITREVAEKEWVNEGCDVAMMSIDVNVHAASSWLLSSLLSLTTIDFVFCDVVNNFLGVALKKAYLGF